MKNKYGSYHTIKSSENMNLLQTNAVGDMKKNYFAHLKPQKFPTEYLRVI